MTPSCLISIADFCELILLGCAREIPVVELFLGVRRKRVENGLILVLV